MKPEEQNDRDMPAQDEDVQFENSKESSSKPLSGSNDKTHAPGETIIPLKEDTLGNSDFPPLTELEKLPKLPEPPEEPEA